MRKIVFAIVIGVMMVIGFSLYIAYKIGSNNNISIEVNDTDDLYRVEASFKIKQTRKLLSYIDAQLSSSKQFRNNHLNKELLLEDHTKLYIRTQPGRLQISINKNENSIASIERIRNLTEGIKLRLTEN
jgi:hypothetical protein